MLICCGLRFADDRRSDQGGTDQAGKYKPSLSHGLRCLPDSKMARTASARAALCSLLESRSAFVFGFLAGLYLVHCESGPLHADVWLWPPGFCFVVVVVQPGLSWHVFVLPPWVLVVVVVNGGEGGLLLFAKAAVEPAASRAARANVDSKRVITYLLSMGAAALFDPKMPIA